MGLEKALMVLPKMLHFYFIQVIIALHTIIILVTDPSYA